MADKRVVVNGPVNTVRMEGNVAGKKKVFYSMFDYHVNKKKCADIHAVDVDTFLLEEFEKLSKIRPDMKFDLMVEIGLIRPYYHDLYEDSYIRRIGRLFWKTFEIDKENNKVIDSKEIPNVRLHHTDVRDIMASVYMKYDIDVPMFPIHIPFLEETYRKIYALRRERVDTYYSLYHTKAAFNPLVEKSIYSLDPQKYDSEHFDQMKKVDVDKQIRKMIYKLRHKYENESVKKKINLIIDTDLKAMLEGFINDLDNILIELSADIDHAKRLKDPDHLILLQRADGSYDYGYDTLEITQMSIRTGKYLEKIGDEITIGLMFMDLYKLRRFLDKDYITNAISYAGGHHSSNYVRLLVKYFDFKITNYSYMAVSIMDEAHQIIKESRNEEELFCLLFPRIFSQCSDLSSFPELFM